MNIKKLVGLISVLCLVIIANSYAFDYLDKNGFEPINFKREALSGSVDNDSCAPLVLDDDVVMKDMPVKPDVTRPMDFDGDIIMNSEEEENFCEKDFDGDIVMEESLVKETAQDDLKTNLIGCIKALQDENLGEMLKSQTIEDLIQSFWFIRANGLGNWFLDELKINGLVSEYNVFKEYNY
jgi:hypothetical protein